MPMPDEIVGLLRSTITIKWSDGHESKYRRATCASPAAARGASRRRPAARCSSRRPSPRHVRAKGINLVGQYAIAIDWSDGHTTGIYNFRDLRANCPCAECAAARAAPRG